ncbi:MAG: FIST C-terminal domain-containing protein [Myxococcales bacterium]|nr:MAG: FIST C-terminal domain-containing protein [Myxococcales bacterium]
MKTASGYSTASEAAHAAREAYEQIYNNLGEAPQLLIVNCTSVIDTQAFSIMLKELAPNSAIHGNTSCLGVMTEQGFHGEDGVAVGLFGVLDHDGAYGSGAAFIDVDVVSATREALEQALQQAQRPGMLPAMVWVSSTPGDEEMVLDSLAEILGPDVPVTGGSAADNTVNGEWKLFCNGRCYDRAVVVSVLFPSTELLFAFHSGYTPTNRKGKVTRAEGRTIFEIDGRAAAEVYDEWTEGALTEHLTVPGNILAHTTLHPLGRAVSSIAGIENYHLSHPDTLLNNGVLSVFSEISVGDELVLMRGTKDSLAERAGRVAGAALKNHGAVVEQVAGALVIYCAGCMLTVRDRMDEVVDSICTELKEAPFLGAFTFGEQGCFAGCGNRHGNLMISVLVFTQ